MSRVVVLGGGIAGYTAAAFARSWLGGEHSVTVVSPRPDSNWVPSNIWVGVGLMKPAPDGTAVHPASARRRGMPGHARRLPASAPRPGPDWKPGAALTRQLWRLAATTAAARRLGLAIKVAPDALATAIGPLDRLIAHHIRNS